MHEVFKKRQLAEQIVLKAATRELHTVMDLGITRDHFIGEFHGDFYDYIISLDKLGTNISTPEKHITLMDSPTPKFKAILDVYATDETRYNLFRIVEMVKRWSNFDEQKTRAQTFLHRLDNWDFKESDKVLQELADRITEVGDVTSIDSIYGPNYVRESFAKLLSGKNKTRNISSGICCVDNKMSGGFKTTKLYTVAARTGCGKTAFATNITLSAAKQGYHCLYITLEMTKDEINWRFLSTLSEVPIEKFDSGNFSQDELARLSPAVDTLESLPINTYGESRGDWSKVESYIRSIKRKRGLSFVVVDYIQQYSCPSRGFRASDKRQEIDYMTGRFKQLALELDFAAIMLAQLNRDIEKDGEREPRLSDIKESSSIEQDSDVVIFLYCTNQAAVDNGEDEEKLISSKIGKNRSGNVGIKHLNTKLSINKFYGI